MWTTTNPQPGWVRWTWTVSNTSQRPSIPEELRDQIPGIIVRDVGPTTGFVEAHESTWELPVMQAWVIASAGARGEGTRPRLRSIAAPAAMWTSLYEHQREGVRFLVNTVSGAILADEPGLGKSRCAGLAALLAIQLRKHGPILITGPKFVRDVWRRELTALGALTRDEDFVALEGVTPTDDAFATRPFWFCHYDILDYWTNRMTFNHAAKRPAVVIFDEAHNGKSPRSIRGKAMVRIAGLVPYRLVLTGTPIANTPRDLYQLLVLVDGPKAWGSPSTFRMRYCGATNDGYGLKDTGPTHTDELQLRIAGRYLSRTKAAVGLNLPPLVRNVQQIDAANTHEVRQGALRLPAGVSMRRLVEVINTGSGGEDVLRILHELRAGTSAVKLPTTIELLDSVLAQGQSVVCFVQERKQSERIWDALQHRKHESVFIHGGLDQDERDHLVQLFQEERGAPRAIVATYGALREGVTLTRASHVVLHDLDWNPSVILQAEARAHRIGTRGTQSHWMVAKNSIDTLFASAVLRKVTQNAETLGDGASSAAREQFAALGLNRIVGATSVEDDAKRLLEAW